jgi:hypothetical protein
MSRHRRHRRRPAVATLACAVATAALAAAWPTLAHAGKGQQTGVIEGVVFMDDGDAAIGAVVTLKGAVLVGGPQTVFTEHDGKFLFIDLPPGTYELKAELGDTQVAYAFDVRVRIAERRKLRLTLTSVEGETIVIEQERPPIDSSRSALSYNMDHEILESLPVDRRSFMALLHTFPGVLQFRYDAPLIRGGSWIDNQILIDGVNYSDPITNSALARFDFHSIGEIEVISGGLEADYGETMGGVINMVTRSGGDTHELGMRASVTPGLLSPTQEGEKSSNHYDLNVNLGGPLAKSQLKYFSSATYQFEFLPFPQPEGIDVAPGRSLHALLGFSKLTWEPVDRHKLTLHLSGYHENRANSAIEDVIEAAAQERARLGGATGQLSWKWLLQKTFVEVSAGLYYYDIEIEPISNDIDTPGAVDQMTGVVSINAPKIWHDRSQRWQLQTSVTHYAEALGAHEIKAGAELSLGRIRYEEARSGNEVLLNMGGPCVPEELVFTGCELAMRTGTQDADGNFVPGAFTAVATGRQIGLFVRDSWALGKGLRLNPGWRVDLGQVTAQSGELIADFKGWLGPRLGIIWDARDRGITVLRANYARYYQTGVLALPLFFGPSMRKEIYRFNPGTGQFDLYEQSRSTGGDTGGVIDLAKSKTPPTGQELLVGAEQAVSRRLKLGVTGIYRRMTHIYNSVEQNLIWNETGDNLIGFRDGAPHASYTLLTSEDFFREYSGVELSARGRFAEAGFVMASYTLARLVGTSEVDDTTDATNVVPFVVANPRQRQFLYGPLNSDRRHVVKASVVYALSKLDLTLGTTFTYASGAPYSRLFYNEFLSQYYDLRAPRGTDPGDLNDPNDDRELRMPALIEWNLYAAWNLASLTGQKDLLLETQVFNLLNRRSATYVQQRDLPADEPGGFGSPLKLQAPFRVTLGVSYRY